MRCDGDASDLIYRRRSCVSLCRRPNVSSDHRSSHQLLALIDLSYTDFAVDSECLSLCPD